MKVLIDIGHPAHVHFFKETIRRLIEKNHQVIITSRKKEMATDLLDDLGLSHIVLTSQKKGIVGLFFELIERNLKLFKVVRERKPDVMMAIGGIFIAQVGFVTRVPSLVFYDTENAKLQNALTYPFATAVIVPKCYKGWVPKKNELRYSGYHELAYLQRGVFQPSMDIAINNGLAPDQPNFFLRLVSWEANHDIGEAGWNEKFLVALIDWLTLKGRVIISSEAQLPMALKKYEYKGKASLVHHVMAFCKLYIGESATMCSESVVLGVPGIYIAKTSRGYVDEQTERYLMSEKVESFDIDKVKSTIDDMIAVEDQAWQARHEAMLADMVDMPEFIISKAQQFSIPSTSTG